MNELHLFAGAGGGIYGSILLGHRVIGYVEIDEYCRKIIRQRRRDGIFDRAPIFGDIRTFIKRYAAAYTGLVDVVCGGVPCQPFSCAGKRLGEADPRNLWPETIEVVRIIRPRFGFFENSSTLLTNRYFGKILENLEAIDYHVVGTPKIIGACHVGAPHKKRDRVWLLVSDARREHGHEGGGSIQTESIRRGVTP